MDETPKRMVERLRLHAAHLLPLVRYLLLTTETHAFSAALAFFALLAFYPFSSMLLSLARYVLGSPQAHAVVAQALREYYPQAQEFLLRNLEVSVALHGREVLFHVLWILLGAAGFFIPLETAFNRLWGFPVGRPYWRNQVVGLLLTIASGVLAVAFVLVTAWAHALIAALSLPAFAADLARSLSLRATALAAWIAAIVLFYRFLPNGKVRTAGVVPAAILAGLLTEVVRLAYILVLPHLDLQSTQGPYYVSIGFALLAYAESFVLLGGAFVAAEGQTAASVLAARPAARTDAVSARLPGRR